MYAVERAILRPPRLGRHRRPYSTSPVKQKEARESEKEGAWRGVRGEVCSAVGPQCGVALLAYRVDEIRGDDVKEEGACAHTGDDRTLYCALL